MDKAIEAIFKVFTHLARDIQTYIFAGCILIGNYYLLDQKFQGGEFTETVLQSPYFVGIIIVAAYILGQICLAFYTLIEISGLEKFLYKRALPKYKVTVPRNKILANKIKSMVKNKDAYIHFVERNNNLGTLRWNYSSAFMLCALMDVCFMLRNHWDGITILNASICLAASILLMVLHIITYHECVKQTRLLFELPDKTTSATEGDRTEGDTSGKGAETTPGTPPTAPLKKPE